MHDDAPVLKRIWAMVSIAFFHMPGIFFPDRQRCRAAGFRYLIVRSCKDTKRCMYATRAHIYCGGFIRELSCPLLFRPCVMLEQERGLCQGEKKYQAGDAPDLEGDPGRSRGVAPHRFIDRGQREKEETPAQSQSAPTLFGEVEGF